jgi:CRISPR-associated protein Cas2
MAHILLVYDITSDKARSKIADACLDYGLDRIQFSSFAGQLSHNHQQELMLRLSAILGDGAGHIMLVPICDKDWQSRQELDHAG